MRKLINQTKNYFLNNSDKCLFYFVAISTIFMTGFAVSRLITENQMQGYSTQILERDIVISELYSNLDSKKKKMNNLATKYGKMTPLEYKKELINKEAGIKISDNLEEKYLDLMMATADYFKIPYKLYFRLGAKESYNFSSTKSSPKGAKFYFQIMPGTFKQYAKLLPSVKEHNIETNIMVSGLILSDLYNTYHGNWTKAVAAYNAGTNAVDKAGGVPNYRETRNYVAYIFEKE